MKLILSFFVLSLAINNTGLCDYQCPRNSVRKPLRLCYNNFDDCQCLLGYAPLLGRCVPFRLCRYRCPLYSRRKRGVLCVNQFDDCECFPRHTRWLGRCVPNSICQYPCPLHSRRKPGRRCYDSFNDCECLPGYLRWLGRCTPLYCTDIMLEKGVCCINSTTGLSQCV